MTRSGATSLLEIVSVLSLAQGFESHVSLPISIFNLAFLDLNSIIARMIRRRKTLELIELIDSNPAVALLGPRQVGKTTLALEIGEQRPSIYLDLESDADRANSPSLSSTFPVTRINWLFSTRSTAFRTSSRLFVD